MEKENPFARTFHSSSSVLYIVPVPGGRKLMHSQALKSSPSGSRTFTMCLEWNSISFPFAGEMKVL